MERNQRLDYFKIVLSILVIAIHIQPLFTEDSFCGWLVSNGISRVAVPAFFVISGYYIYAKINDFKAIKKYLLHLLLIYFTWALFYLPYFIDSSYKSLCFWIIFGYDHLWYMPASMLGVILVYLAKKVIKSDMAILYIAGVLYFTGLIISLIKGVDYFTVYFFRNGLTVGFFYTMLGCYINAKDLDQKISKKGISVIALISAILIFFEIYYRFHNLKQLGPYQDLILFMPIFCVAIFILVLKYPKHTDNKGFVNVLSSGVYFIHPFAIRLVSKSFVEGIYKLPIVLIMPIVFTFIVYLINKRVKIFF